MLAWLAITVLPCSFCSLFHKFSPYFWISSDGQGVLWLIVVVVALGGFVVVHCVCSWVFLTAFCQIASILSSKKSLKIPKNSKTNSKKSEKNRASCHVIESTLLSPDGTTWGDLRDEMPEIARAEAKAKAKIVCELIYKRRATLKGNNPPKTGLGPLALLSLDSSSLNPPCYNGCAHSVKIISQDRRSYALTAYQCMPALWRVAIGTTYMTA